MPGFVCHSARPRPRLPIRQRGLPDHLGSARFRRPHGPAGFSRARRPGLLRTARSASTRRENRTRRAPCRSGSSARKAIASSIFLYNPMRDDGRRCHRHLRRRLRRHRRAPGPGALARLGGAERPAALAENPDDLPHAAAEILGRRSASAGSATARSTTRPRRCMSIATGRRPASRRWPASRGCATTARSSTACGATSSSRSPTCATTSGPPAPRRRWRARARAPSSTCRWWSAAGWSRCSTSTTREVRNWRPDELTLIKEIAERTRTAVQRHRNEAALRESEERYRRLFDAIDEGFCIIEFFDGRTARSATTSTSRPTPPMPVTPAFPTSSARSCAKWCPTKPTAGSSAMARCCEPASRSASSRSWSRPAGISNSPPFRIEPPSRRRSRCCSRTSRRASAPRRRCARAKSSSASSPRPCPNHVWAARPNGDLYWFNNQVYAYRRRRRRAASTARRGPASFIPTILPTPRRAWARRARRPAMSTKPNSASAAATEPIAGSSCAPSRFARRTARITNWIGTNTDIETHAQSGRRSSPISTPRSSSRSRSAPPS